MLDARVSRSLFHSLAVFARLAVVVVAACLTAFAGAAQTAGLRDAQLTILHINDVYETGPVDGRGGLARVAALERQIVK
jgi:2',3'-cyclic-nucleotide 2'-phosphodiesterase (5'-nucleotidase family)